MNDIARTFRTLPLILITGLTVGCSQGPGGHRGGDGDDEKGPAPIPVEARHVVRGDITASYTGTANLETDAEAEVVAKVGGEVVQILVEEGDRVREGQILARLDGDRLRLELERNHANLAKLQQEYQRNRELHERQLVSADAFEQLKFEMESLEAAYELAELELSYTEIKAPFEGVISERLIKVGNTIAQNTGTFRISALDPLLAYLYVPERQYDKLRAGQLARVRADALPNKLFEARVARISPVVDPGTGTFKVTVEVSDPSKQLRPGMFARIGIVYDRRQDVVLVPASAVISEGGDESVFVLLDGEEAERYVTAIQERRAALRAGDRKDGDEDERGGDGEQEKPPMPEVVVKRVDVSKGYAEDGSVEIVSGLAGDERIVVIGQASLKDGAAVKVVAMDGRPVELAEEDEGSEDAAEDDAAAGDAAGSAV